MYLLFVVAFACCHVLAIENATVICKEQVASLIASPHCAPN